MRIEDELLDEASVVFRRRGDCSNYYYKHESLLNKLCANFKVH